MRKPSDAIITCTITSSGGTVNATSSGGGLSGTLILAFLVGLKVSAQNVWAAVASATDAMASVGSLKNSS